MLRDQAEAEDVAQETMVRLMRKAETWEPGGAKVKTWLFRVAINQCIDRQRARRTTSLDVVVEQADPNTAGATVARDHALRRSVGGAVDGLPARQKQEKRQGVATRVGLLLPLLAGGPTVGR